MLNELVGEALERPPVMPPPEWYQTKMKVLQATKERQARKKLESKELRKDEIIGGQSKRGTKKSRMTMKGKKKKRH